MMHFKEELFYQNLDLAFRKSIKFLIKLTTNSFLNRIRNFLKLDSIPGRHLGPPFFWTVRLDI